MVLPKRKNDDTPLSLLCGGGGGPTVTTSTTSIGRRRRKKALRRKELLRRCVCVMAVAIFGHLLVMNLVAPWFLDHSQHYNNNNNNNEAMVLSSDLPQQQQQQQKMEKPDSGSLRNGGNGEKKETKKDKEKTTKDKKKDKKKIPLEPGVIANADIDIELVEANKKKTTAKKYKTNKKAAASPLIEPYMVIPDIDTLPTVEEFGWPLVHVVQSRFQIGQGTLVKLAKARFELFKHFTYPAMKAQTTQQFLWLIHVGYELKESELFQELIDMMTPYDHIYVIENDFPSGRFGLRTFEEVLFLGGMLNFTIHTGNQTRLELAMSIAAKARHRQKKKGPRKIPVVTTRLDMDDAVESTFFEKVHETTLREFVYTDATPPKYLFWCTLNTLEWNFVFNQTAGGFVKTMSYTKCPSTGLTVTGKSPNGVGLGEHTLLMEKLAATPGSFADPEDKDAFYGCGYANTSDCLVIYPELKGFRSRAPTSNSYFFAKQWDTEQAQLVKKYNKGAQKKLANELHERFLIEPPPPITTTNGKSHNGNDDYKNYNHKSNGGGILYVNNYFNQHLCDIVTDFTASYCSARGFTCTDKVKEEYDKLQSMLNCKLPALTG